MVPLPSSAPSFTPSDAMEHRSQRCSFHWRAQWRLAYLIGSLLSRFHISSPSSTPTLILPRTFSVCVTSR